MTIVRNGTIMCSVRNRTFIRDIIMNEKMNRIESLYNMLYKETDEIYGKLAHFSE